MVNGKEGRFFSVWNKANRKIRLLPYSPIPVLGLSSFRSFGYASLVGRCPTPRKGAALDPAGNQSPAPRARIRSLVMSCAMLFSFLFL